MKPPVLAVAHDPGGANAVACTVAELRARGCSVGVVARGPARRQFERLRVEVDGSDVSFDGVRVVVCGSSVHDGIEREAIATAAELHVPTVSLIDYWSNFRARYERLPDVLVAIDAACFAGMVADGIPRARIQTLGQPYFGWLIEQRLPPRSAGPVRRLLVASEPGTESPQALAAVARLRASRPLDVTVRFHPREQQRCLDLEMAIDSNLDPMTTLREHDGVLGLTSTFLVESALQGVPTASWGRPEMLLRYGLVQPVDELTLADFLDDPRRPVIADAFIESQRGAAARVAEFVLRQV